MKNSELKLQMHTLPLTFLGIPIFPNHEPCLSHTESVLLPIFFGNSDSVVMHIMSFISLANEINMIHEDNMTQIFVNSLDEKAWMWYHSLLDECVTSLENFFVVFFKRWDDGEGDVEAIVERDITYLKR